MNCAQTKNGRRNQVRPGARSWTMVVMKFSAPSSDEKIRQQHAGQPQRLAVTARGPTSGAIGRPAVLAAPPGDEEAGEHDDAAGEVEPVAGQVEPRKRHVGRADLQRHHVVAEGADRERHDAEEHHDGAVHRAELVVELGQDMPPGAFDRAEQAADRAAAAARIGQLPADDERPARSRPAGRTGW